MIFYDRIKVCFAHSCDLVSDIAHLLFCARAVPFMAIFYSASCASLLGGLLYRNYNKISYKVKNRVEHKLYVSTLFYPLKSFLTLLNKLCSALRTGNTNLSFSSRNSHLLLARRTFIKMIYLALFPVFLSLIAFYNLFISPCSKLLILRIPFVNLSRHHSVIFVNHQSKSKQIKDSPSGKHGYD